MLSYACFLTIPYYNFILLDRCFISNIYSAIFQLLINSINLILYPTSVMFLSVVSLLQLNNESNYDVFYFFVQIDSADTTIMSVKTKNMSFEFLYLFSLICNFKWSFTLIFEAYCSCCILHILYVQVNYLKLL